jgi:hypothetical protein
MPFTIRPYRRFPVQCNSRRARREVKPGDMGGAQGLIVKLNTLLAVCGVGIDESFTVKVRL